MAMVRRVVPPKAPEVKQLRVAAYARVSTSKDAMLQSLSAQVSYFNNYIQRHPGWQLAGIYADEALTGTRDDRPEFQRLLQDCRDGKIDMIITKAISRFARNTVTLLKTTRELKKLGVAVFFQKEGLYANSGQGEMVLTLLAAVAQEESRTVSDNCKWRIRNRFKKGELVNFRFMYGYRIRNNKVEIEPMEAEIVKSVFEDYLAGLGCEAIARSLRERGVATTFGGLWTANRLRVMLKNEKYAGNALLQKKYVADHIAKKEILNRGQLTRYHACGTHPAIIEPAMFERVQQLIETNRVNGNVSRDTPANYPFTKIIQCGNCGKSYRRIVHNNVPRWQCATYLREGRSACPAKQIPEEVLCVLVSQVLGMDSFDDLAMKRQIRNILITGPNSMRFVFLDGHALDAEWPDRSRRESWTDAMKQQARDRSLRKGLHTCRQPESH